MKLRILIFCLILINFLLIGYLISENENYETALVLEIIDGDTIKTDIGTIRLLGINCPEKNKYYYEQSKNYLENLQNKQIKLFKTSENKDRYNRKLRYIFFQGKNINLEIIKKGLGHTYYYDNDKFTSSLESREIIARQQERGIWKSSKNQCKNCIKLVKLNHIDPGEYLILKNFCRFDCNLSGWNIKDEANHFKILDFSLNPGEQYQVNYSGRIWNDAGDSLFLRDEKGLLVLFYEY